MTHRAADGLDEFLSQVPEPDREYLVLISYLPQRRFTATPRMTRLIVQVCRQLGSATGLIGYTLDARPFAREYWTLSAWRTLPRWVASSRSARTPTSRRRSPQT